MKQATTETWKAKHFCAYTVRVYIVSVNKINTKQKEKPFYFFPRAHNSFFCVVCFLKNNKRNNTPQTFLVLSLEKGKKKLKRSFSVEKSIHIKIRRAGKRTAEKRQLLLDWESSQEKRERKIYIQQVGCNFFAL